jgi:biopolymer transport protein ExbD
VTPLVDVVLVLLIIFMVVTPAPQSALDLGISKVVQAEAGSRHEKKEQVFVRVTATNQVYLNDKEVPSGSLKSALESTFKGRTGDPLFFEADPSANYPEVIQVLDQVSAAGVQHVAIVHREKSAGSGSGPR